MSTAASIDFSHTHNDIKYVQIQNISTTTAVLYGHVLCLCVCVFSSHSFWTSNSLDVPAGVTQEEDHTGFFIHLLSAVRALIFLAEIQPFLSLVGREVEFCELKTNIKMPNGWRTIKSSVHKIRLHGRRGKGMAESFSREK